MQVSAAAVGDELYIKKRKKRKKLVIVTIPKCLSRSPWGQIFREDTQITKDLQWLTSLMKPRHSDCFAEFYGHSFCVYIAFLKYLSLH